MAIEIRSCFSSSECCLCTGRILTKKIDVNGTDGTENVMSSVKRDEFGLDTAIFPPLVLRANAFTANCTA